MRSPLLPDATDGSFRPSGLAAVPRELAAGCSQPEALAAAGNGGSVRPCPSRAVPGKGRGRGSAGCWAAENASAPGSPLRAGRGERGLSRGRGSGALTFLHAGAERPPRLALPVFEQSFPDWIWREKETRVVWREGWNQAGPRHPSAHPRAASPQPPAAPPCLPRRCGEARKRVQEKGNPISDPAGEAFK